MKRNSLNTRKCNRMRLPNRPTINLYASVEAHIVIYYRERKQRCWVQKVQIKWTNLISWRRTSMRSISILQGRVMKKIATFAPDDAIPHSRRKGSVPRAHTGKGIRIDLPRRVKATLASGGGGSPRRSPFTTNSGKSLIVNRYASGVGSAFASRGSRWPVVFLHLYFPKLRRFQEEARSRKRQIDFAIKRRLQ